VVASSAAELRQNFAIRYVSLKTFFIRRADSLARV
jgi:hypothetical protein